MDAKRKRLDLRGETAIHGPADLPEHLVFEILSWLPAATLVRFKLVKKSWRDHIESPMFAAKHLCHQNRSSSRSSDSMLLVSQFNLDRNRYGYRFSLVSFADKDTSNVVKSIEYPFYTGDKVSVSGCCHGIICLSGEGDFVALANPGIRQFRVLPGSCISFPSTEPEPDYGCNSGFGYDPISGDYKVVRIWKIYGETTIRRVEIYTLSTDSWREINGEPFLAERRWYDTPGKYFNGAFYWCKVKQSIIVFDMSKEVFVRVRCPEPYCCFSDDRTEWNLLIMNESLVLLSYRSSLDCLEIQEIHRNGGDKSGFGVTKLETIEPPQGYEAMHPLLFWKNGEILFQYGSGPDDVRIVSYNKGSDGTKSVPIRLSQNSRQPCQVTAEFYTSSLISIAGGQQLDGGN